MLLHIKGKLSPRGIILHHLVTQLSSQASNHAGTGWICHICSRRISRKELFQIYSIYKSPCINLTPLGCIFSPLKDIHVAVVCCHCSTFMHRLIKFLSGGKGHTMPGVMHLQIHIKVLHQSQEQITAHVH